MLPPTIQSDSVITRSAHGDGGWVIVRRTQGSRVAGYRDVVLPATLAPQHSATHHPSPAFHCRHPCREGVDGVVAIQRAELEIVCARLARLQDDQLARLPGGEASRVAIRARLDADDVRPLSQHAPDEMP